MQELQRKIITDAIKGRIEEIKEEVIELAKFDTKEEEVELYFYQEFLNNLDNFAERSQYWNYADIFKDGTADEGPYKNPLSAIDSLVVISRICSLAKDVISSFKEENIDSVYIEGMTINFKKFRDEVER